MFHSVGWWCFLSLLLWHGATTDTVLSPDDPRIHYIGRHRLDSKASLWDWIGTGFAIRIVSGVGMAGGTAYVDMDGGGNRFAVFLNGGWVRDIFAEPYAGRMNYSLAFNVGADTTITLRKTTEAIVPAVVPHAKAWATAVSLFGVWLNDCEAGPYGSAPKRKFVVYGDSDSTSFGVDSLDAKGSCPLKWPPFRLYENLAHGWVMHVEKKLQAEAHIQAVSGIGVVKNAGSILAPVLCPMFETMPKLVRRTLQLVDADDYDPSSFVPSVVVVMVGGNDYFNLLKPSNAEFTEAYSKMVADIAEMHGPDAKLMHICEAGLKPPCTLIESLARASAQMYFYTGDADEPRSGCGDGGATGHRNASQQEVLAHKIAPIIAKVAGWDDTVLMV